MVLFETILDNVLKYSFENFGRINRFFALKETILMRIKTEMNVAYRDSVPSFANTFGKTTESLTETFLYKLQTFIETYIEFDKKSFGMRELISNSCNLHYTKCSKCFCF